MLLYCTFITCTRHENPYMNTEKHTHIHTCVDVNMKYGKLKVNVPVGFISLKLLNNDCKKYLLK